MSHGPTILECFKCGLEKKKLLELGYSFIYRCYIGALKIYERSFVFFKCSLKLKKY